MAFDETKVPAGPARDYFYSGRTGEGITDEQYDIQKQRLLDAGVKLPWEQEEEEES